MDVLNSVVIIPVAVHSLILVVYIHFFRCEIFVNWINDHCHTASNCLRRIKTGGLSRSPNAVTFIVLFILLIFMATGLDQD